MVLDLTAKDKKTGKVIWSDKREYFEIGLDWDGDRRYGAWQIKDIIDFSLPPRTTTTEKFYVIFNPDTKEVDLEIKVRYIHRAGLEFLVHDLKYSLNYAK
ncbi:MAG: hypothetical protein NZ850_07255 [Caldimicrobium sp.]|nr:hypothetical protein [Caldimicrobium sp.]